MTLLAVGWPQVMFFVDDLGYGDMGFTGHPTAHTPALDRLAATGKRLTQWYSAYPVCTSSRTALMTGRQPARVGMPGVINSLSAAGLPLSEVTLANDLSSLGCECTLQAAHAYVCAPCVSETLAVGR